MIYRQPASRVIRRRKQTPSPAKPSFIVDNQNGFGVRITENGLSSGGNFTIFPSKSRAKSALAKIIKGLPNKVPKEEEPLYSVMVVK